ncbi:MAG: DUF2288 domain-containing protein [Burkholderiaceae bacterium]|nr:DUF2288 domain-containing protein [Burkholderiaceae bacterium]
MNASAQEREVLYAKLNLETATMPWRELQRYFASGNIISVTRDVDMVRVAVMMAVDDVAQVSRLLGGGQIGRVTDGQAQAWFDADTVLWTVVVKPWILVQAGKY